MRKPTSPRRSAVSRGEHVAATLRDEILRGRYAPGERLPSERELSARFDTSRGAVREALKRVEQLGLASTRPGGVRAVGVEHCTLDVLGPLLDLDDVPDPKLVDEVLQTFGVLLETATREAITKAGESELTEAGRIIDELTVGDDGQVSPHGALRRLAALFIDVADHLVLRLIANGLRTTFFGRLEAAGIRPALEARVVAEPARQLRAALAQRDADEAVRAMRRINGLVRERAESALRAARSASQRESA